MSRPGRSDRDEVPLQLDACDPVASVFGGTEFVHASTGEPSLTTSGPASRTLVTTAGGRIGLSVPERVSFKKRVGLHDEQHALVAVELTLDASAQRYRLTSLSVTASDEDGELDATTLRAVRVGEIAAEAIGKVGKLVVLDDDGTPTVHIGEASLTNHERVAALWLIARLNGEHPNGYIAQRLGISSQAAARRVLRARQAGLIPPAAGPGARR